MMKTTLDQRKLARRVAKADSRVPVEIVNGWTKPVKKRMIYINGKYRNQRETIDAFETRKEARESLAEYRMAFGPEWDLWLSSRPCADWEG